MREVSTTTLENYGYFLEIIILQFIESEFEDAGFCEGRKTGELREKPSELGKNHPQIQPTYGTGPGSNTGHI